MSLKYDSTKLPARHFLLLNDSAKLLSVRDLLISALYRVFKFLSRLHAILLISSISLLVGFTLCYSSSRIFINKTMPSFPRNSGLIRKFDSFGLLYSLVFIRSMRPCIDTLKSLLSIDCFRRLAMKPELSASVVSVSNV